MDFDDFGGYQFGFDMLKRWLTVEVPYPQTETDNGMPPKTTYQPAFTVEEPIVNSNYANVNSQNVNGGQMYTDTNGWESHLSSIPAGTKVSDDSGHHWEVTSQSGYEIIGNLYYYQLKRVN